MQPLISVITPTWRRHDLLLNRCIPSVQAQTYPNVQHVIFSDGPDIDLMMKLKYSQGRHPVVYGQFPERDPAWEYGSRPRRAAIEGSTGDLITYVDDDDALRPDHCSLMVAALEADPEAGFAVSRMVSHHAHPVVVGWGALAMGNVGSPMIAHRRETLEHGTWGPDSWTEDWELVQRWMDAGVKHADVDAETSDVYPSVFRLHYRYARLHHPPRQAGVCSPVPDGA